MFTLCVSLRAYFCRSGCGRTDRLESWRWSWCVRCAVTHLQGEREREGGRGDHDSGQRWSSADDSSLQTKAVSVAWTTFRHPDILEITSESCVDCAFLLHYFLCRGSDTATSHCAVLYCMTTKLNHTGYRSFYSTVSVHSVWLGHNLGAWRLCGKMINCW